MCFVEQVCTIHVVTVTSLPRSEYARRRTCHPIAVSRDSVVLLAMYNPRFLNL
jgi:hypothetical protein